MEAEPYFYAQFRVSDGDRRWDQYFSTEDAARKYISDEMNDPTSVFSRHQWRVLRAKITDDPNTTEMEVVHRGGVEDG